TFRKTVYHRACKDRLRACGPAGKHREFQGGRKMAENYEQTLAHVNTNSKPTDLKITDMRFVDIVGAPMHCTLLRIETNQGITGYGEVRDGASKLYAQMLKRFLIGENPCNIDK